MNTSNGQDHSPDSAERRASIERRREALRRIGRTGAAAGAASPLASLAGGGYPGQWVRDKYNTKKVRATISGCNSVLASASPTKETYGKPCSYFGTKSNLPSTNNCSLNRKFADYFGCAIGSYDSKGKQYKNDNGANGCLYWKSITTLCSSTTYQSTEEACWITAYCNASLLYASCKYPYAATEVKTFFGDTAKKADALAFFKTCMMNAT